MEVTCLEVNDQMTDFLNGALEPDKAQQFRWHMAKCEHCRSGCREALRAVREFMARPDSDGSAHDATE